ncbi:LuxR family maltose regulon positive regulatory protein [Paenibacillus harenae]|nr:LuxR family maltose regulon positive regulatory protein [Paenibacillus harenae]
MTERLSEGLHRKLSLVSASAGYGKTTLVSEWLSVCDRPAVWLSLDKEDNSLPRFLSYLAVALDSIKAGLAEHVLNLLQSPQPPPIQTIVAVMINDMANFSKPIILVLDDYHVIHTGTIHEAIAFLLDHLPPTVHLVIITREKPDLPLARLRVRNQVTELGVTDLQFNHSETVTFINHVMNLEQSEESISALEHRTEGWISGLHISALSIQQHPKSIQSIMMFEGNHRLLQDYLTEEVLQRQSESVQKFLLYTSVLDRFCGSLCDAVLLDGVSVPGDEVLRSLERANLFIIPLDHEGRWYRYHHLFTGLLRRRLQHFISSAESVSELHNRASHWYLDHGFESEAFRHAVAAGNNELATRLVEGEGMPLHLRGELAPVLNWLASLSSKELDERPSLWVMYGSALLMAGKPTEIETKLKAAEAAMHAQGLETSSKPNDIVGLIATTRAALAAIAITGQHSTAELKLQAAEDAMQLTDGDDKTNDLVGQIPSPYAALAADTHLIDRVIDQSRRALEYLNRDVLPVRLTATWLKGMANQVRGDREEAAAAYDEALTISRKMKNNIIGIMAKVGQGSLLEADNRLFEAEDRYRNAIMLTGGLPVPVVSEAYIGLARIYYEWNDLDKALEYAHNGMQLARLANNTDALVTCQVFLARLKVVDHDWVGADAILDDATMYVRKQGLLNRLPEIAAVQVLGRIGRGDSIGAVMLARRHKLYLGLSRAHLANKDTALALTVLEPFLSFVDDRGWRDDQLRTKILHAMALHAHGENEKAVQSLAEALVMAEQGGFIRIIIDEGLAIVPLLSEVSARGEMLGYIDKLLAAWEAEKKRRGLKPVTKGESLTPRELEILQLIAQGYSNREIGEHLFLALDTVKGHNRRIFEKLHVARRTEAIAIARKLGWIP